MFDLSSLRAQLKAKREEKQRYLDTAAKIKAIYDRMSNDKATIKNYRSDVKTFIYEDYDSFKGDLFKNKYQAAGVNLLSGYQIVIDNLDENMDRLNTARCEWENKAYACDPIIGHLESLINSIVASIQNQFN